MKIPISWLKEFVSIKGSVETLAEKLTLAGFEVEEIIEVDGEKILEINVSPNRGDCLSIFGMAREVKAILGLPLRSPLPRKIQKSHVKGDRSFSVVVKAGRSCPRYSLALMDGVRVGSSPEWIVRRLSQVGIRSVNNVVDVTNYVMMELGQPLHAFDRKKIRGNKIIVRLARESEKLLTLDGEEHDLLPEDLVIADAEGAIALAGVMGGKDSEIDSETTEIALECAFFEPSGIRRTARRLGLQTESSYRFERRVDPDLLPALDRVIQLIQKISGGEVKGPLRDVRKNLPRTRKILFSPQQVDSLLGGKWSLPDMKKNFGRLSLSVREKGKTRWEVTTPSYRGDLLLEADLVEEVARLGGIDRIPIDFPPLETIPAEGDRGFLVERMVRRSLVSLGLQEAIHLSFSSPDDIKKFDPGFLDHAVVLENPLGHEYSVLRPTLIPSLLNRAAHCHRHRIMTVRLFELRKRFQKIENRVVERRGVAGILAGARLLSHWSDGGSETDFYDVKGVVGRLLSELGLGDISFSQTEAPFLHPGKQAGVLCGKERLGVLGELHPDLQDKFELKRPAYLFEIDLETALHRPEARRSFEGYSLHPIVERDLAIVVDEKVPARSILDSILKEDPSIQNVSVFDLYRGEPIPVGKKSLAFSIQLGLKDRTLRDEEIQLVCDRVIRNLKNQFSVELR